MRRTDGGRGSSGYEREVVNESALASFTATAGEAACEYAAVLHNSAKPALDRRAEANAGSAGDRAAAPRVKGERTENDAEGFGNDPHGLLPALDELAPARPAGGAGRRTPPQLHVRTYLDGLSRARVEPDALAR
ncbi:hypothetical protein EVAR_37361_1 [Eumeta japonica]|uniref:Uncharacterized protein n=1 Tax=Eumeta variegata TaxID=151549 RepID=A0A4C1WXL4_EUMVA|nr:hypothetical protein EVAR_37361_1 [Eumeta japonica]